MSILKEVVNIFSVSSFAISHLLVAEQSSAQTVLTSSTTDSKALYWE